jgi:hypothetical protein
MVAASIASAGLAYDYMIGSSFGAFGSDLSLSQWRGEIAYALNGCNEFGVWGAKHDRGYGNSFGALGAPIEYRATNQIDLFGTIRSARRAPRGALRRASDRDPPGADAVRFSAGRNGGKLGSIILG